MAFSNFKKMLAMVALGTMVFANSAQAKDVEINFGIISTESSQNLRKNWEPFLAEMEKKTGYKIKPFFSSDYAGIVTGMQYGKVQLAWFGNKSAKEAVDRANAEIFLKTIAADGTDGYYSYILAHVDSPINSLEDMFAKAHDLNFGNGDPNSTSGFLVPSYYVFAQNNKDAKKIFKRVLTASHETNALSVANKQVDVATCETGTLGRLALNNPQKHKQLKIIWTSPIIPSDPIAWRKDLPAEVKETLRTFFLHYGVKGDNVEAEKKILASLSWGPFRASSNDQLLTIRQLELFKNKTAILANTNLSEEEKKAKVEAIDAQLQKLEARIKSLGVTVSSRK